jgi:hypothetical protein
MYSYIYPVSQSHFTADSQSVCLGVEPTLGLLTIYCFLFKSLGLGFVVLSLWGALSDERPGLSFVSLSPIICLFVHLLFTFLCFTHLPHIYKYTYTHTQYIQCIQGLFQSLLGIADCALLLTSSSRYNGSLHVSSNRLKHFINKDAITLDTPCNCDRDNLST